MSETVKLSRVDSALERLTYPVARDEAADAYADTTLTFADGQANLGELVSETHSETYRSSEELSEELYNVLPVEALGEPGQSDGDA
ncbi:hypothetical protein AUR64_11555 [Haloprofundus marisrubri]|uniref:DUF2795 domain-containing protein n=1 Tax=Haloprofundus marisrubri TaxID=1514971 RepID=A0A0W1RA54_9EURY|nr:hypothetical protein [Haloprofundus marisrubri]KTG10214.1 hypothetical protein AUR64_11555 [Haloprofundus marisrubri]